jgi:hypothetical protein
MDSAVEPHGSATRALGRILFAAAAGRQVAEVTHPVAWLPRATIRIQVFPVSTTAFAISGLSAGRPGRRTGRTER